MAIRLARIEDIPQLVELGRRMHPLTRFSKFDFDAKKVARSFTDVIERGRGKYVVFVASGSNDRVVGGLLGVLEQHMFSDQLTASIVHFDVLPEARAGGYAVRLLKAFELWCANRRVHEVAFGINSGIEVQMVARFAERSGYKAVGANFAKDLK